ncbi:MAG: ATP-binding protein [Gaiellaceae bacterium]
MPVLEGVVEALADRADRAGVGLRIQGAPSFALPLRQRMLQVVAQNLAENAVRYAGAGATCTLACAEGDGALLLTVSDDGAGVPEEDLPRLFERFYRPGADL